MTRSEIFAKGLGTILGVMVPCLAGVALAGATAEEIGPLIFVAPIVCYCGWQRGRKLGREELRQELLPSALKVQAILDQRKVQP